MSKKNPEKLLREFVNDAVLKDGLVDSDTLNFDKYREIINTKLYDEGIDWDIFWNVIFNHLLKYHDWENKNKALTDDQKNEFASLVHKFLGGVPYKYAFYFKLPDNYPLKPEKLNKDISIIKTDQAFIDAQEKLNPASDFDKMIHGNKQASNHQLLSPNKSYMLINDRGLVITGKNAFLESSYSPDRIFGIFLAVHLITENLRADKLARDNQTTKVYDDSGKYRANFVSPIKASRAEHLEFYKKVETTKMANKVFVQLITHQKDKHLESARIQLCNSLYWYVEFLNSEETSLQLVFLVSAFDSLFPPRQHSVFKKRQVTPTAQEKAPVIAEVASNSQLEIQTYLEIIEKLFDERNKVIHGKVEIHGYRKSAKRQNNDTVELVNDAQRLFERYLKRRIAKFVT